MINKNVVFFLGVLLVISFVSAIDTNIAIKTVPYHEVQIAISESGVMDYTLIERFIQYSNQNGDVFVVFSSEVKKFDISVFIKTMEGDSVMEPYRDDEVPAGEDIELRLAPSGFEFIEGNYTDSPEFDSESSSDGNETVLVSDAEAVDLVDDKPIVVSSEDNAGSFFSGFTVFSKEAFTNKTTYYTFGGALLVMMLAVGFFVFGRRKARLPGEEKEIKVKKLSEIQSEKEQKAEDKSQETQEIEAKMKELQKRLDGLTKEEKVKEAKKKLEEAERELIRLRQEGNQ